MEKKTIVSKKNEIAIDVFDIVKEFARKWWLLIGIMVLFATLLTASTYCADMRKAKIEKGINKDKIQEIQNSLNENELELVNKYVYLLQIEQNRQDYLSDSILMNLNTRNMAMSTAEFSVTLDDQNSSENLLTKQNDITDIVASISSYVKGGSLAVDMIEDGADVNSDYLQELITLSTTSYNSTSNSNIISVKILFNNKDEAAELLDILIQNIIDFSTSTEEKFTPYTLETLSNSTIMTVDDDVFAKQLARQNEVEETSAQIEDAKEKMTEKEVALGNYLFSGKEASEEKVQATSMVSINKKMLLMGIGIGFVVGLFIIVILYIFDGKVKTEDDIRCIYNLQLLGKIKLNHSNNFDLIKEKIRTIAEFQKVSNIALIGQTKCLLNIDKDRVFELFNKGRVKVNDAGNIVTEADAFQKFAENEAVIIVVKVRETKSKDVYEMVCNCNELNKKIIGYLIIN